jgi:hypothetical protein
MQDIDWQLLLMWHNLTSATTAASQAQNPAGKGRHSVEEEGVLVST